MPRENRKRGKKHKKEVEPAVDYEPEPEPTPSWILPNTSQQPEVNAEAPFGYVDADVKAYFRTVDLQIREWQDNAPVVQEDTESDPNEDRRLFLVAALKEMSEKELQLATDPDCSSILERMAYSMDDFTRRVFLDRLAGSYEQLLKHRFASHVCQTMFSVATDTVSRESRGIFPTIPDSDEQGELRTMIRLVLDACEEIIPSLSSLIMDPFASHIIRAILTLLLPHAFPSESSKFTVRSKKSASWKAHQGPMKSMFAVDAEAKILQANPIPKFTKIARKFVEKIREELGGNEIRALAANQVASPVLQMLLEVESDQGMSDQAGSLMDHVLVDLISLQKIDPSCAPEPTDYLTTLLRDPTSSHLLETLVSMTPEAVFGTLWATYFQGKLARLAAHPVANFVIAKAFARISGEQLREVLLELQNSWQKIIRSSRVGVVRAVVERAAVLHCEEGEITQAIFSAFELETQEEKLLLVPCVLRLLSANDYATALTAHDTADAENKEKSDDKRRRGKANSSQDPLEPKVPGALLLQSMIKLSSPHNDCVLQSIQALSTADLLAVAQHQTSSRVLDAVFDSPNVTINAKHKVIMAFIGQFHQLVDDRIGSRVGDRCLLVADPYLKDKIARSLLPYEHNLAGSQYGKYFARNLNLVLYKRDPTAWKRMQAAKSSGPSQEPKTAPQSAPPDTLSIEVEGAPKASKRKRKAKAEDDIDELFDSAFGGKKVRRAITTKEEQPEQTDAKKEKAKADGLQDVLGAIRKAPKEDKGRRKKT